MGRRENLPSGFAGAQISPGPQSYVYDGGAPVQSIGNSGSTINYLRDDSGETVAESWDGSAAQVPLRDAVGSTIAMVDTASGNVASSYSYTPTGAVARSGTGYVTPYQFGGTENDTFAYYGANRYYSPTMRLALSVKPPIIAPGGTETGLGRSAPGAIPGDSGLDVGFHLQQQAEFAAAGAVAGAVAGTAVSVLLGVAEGATWGSTFGPAGMGIGAFLGALIGFLGIFGGGGPSYSPTYIRKVTHQGGIVATWEKQNGAPKGLVLDQNSVAGKVVPVQFYGYNYCGPGNNRGPTEPHTVDDCCKAHDNCYQAAGLGTLDAIAHPFGMFGEGSAQENCDAALCNCVDAVSPSTDPNHMAMKNGIQEYFCH